jgi:hypothetical protein
MSISTEFYRYRPLSSERNIRTLTLKPSLRHAALVKIGLEEQRLPKKPRVKASYEALSYVWGTLARSEPILCDGKIMLVTPNCLAALRSLRFRSKSRRLWIDAISIDQTSDGEKCCQNKVYGRRVCLCLANYCLVRKSRY